MSERNPDSPRERYMAAMDRVLKETGPALDAYRAQRESEPRWKRRWFSKRVERRALAVYMRTMHAQRESIEGPRRARG